MLGMNPSKLVFAVLLAAATAAIVVRLNNKAAAGSNTAKLLGKG